MNNARLCHLKDRFGSDVMDRKRADRREGQGQLMRWDASHSRHLHGILNLVPGLDPGPLHGLGGVRERMPEHVKGHHLVGYIGRGENGVTV